MRHIAAIIVGCIVIGLVILIAVLPPQKALIIVALVALSPFLLGAAWLIGGLTIDALGDIFDRWRSHL